MGIPNENLRLSTSNKDYHLSTSYPALLCVPAERYITDSDLEHVGLFRSRGRLPACVWQHPKSRQTIWRCSQPKVGVHSARCSEDEKLLAAISECNRLEALCIFDCRPKMNARANILAGKGFESVDNYKNCKIFFMNIQNIHVMRESYNKLVKACQQDAHSTTFPAAIANSGWSFHISELLKATFQMVLSVDRDKLSILSHCSDGWDRTSQLVSLTELCLDPFYRTTKGFFVLIEKDWISFGHQFAKRTGHREKNHSDEQRSPVFLQWLDCVYQLTVQFPRHFEFNSHLLCTLALHLYSCRFGTFLFNTEMTRKKTKLQHKTQSLWTYLLCSPAAVSGEFTNPLYCSTGKGFVEENDPRTAAATAAKAAGSFSPKKSVNPSLIMSGGSIVGKPLTNLYATRSPGSHQNSLIGPMVPHNSFAQASNLPGLIENSSEFADALANIDTSPATIVEDFEPSVCTAQRTNPAHFEAAVQSLHKSFALPTPIYEANQSNVNLFNYPHHPSESHQTQPNLSNIPHNNSNSNSIASNHSNIASSNSIPAAAVEEIIKKQSIGRGGGDGSIERVGAVIYPSYSMKKIQLWSDYFLRWHSDQAEHGGIGPGSVPPFGSASAHFHSNEGLYQKSLRTANKAKERAEETIQQQQIQLATLEAQLNELRSQLAAQSYNEASHSNKASNGINNSEIGAAVQPASNILSALVGKSPSQPPSAPGLVESSSPNHVKTPDPAEQELVEALLEQPNLEQQEERNDEEDEPVY
jgi:hypothetical protein